MDRDSSAELIQQATLAYRNVVSDPQTHGPLAAQLAIAARKRGDRESQILFLRAHAWAQRAKLSLTEAKAILDEAAALARRHQLPQRLGEVLVTRAAVNTELGRLQAAQRDLTSAGLLQIPDGAVEMALQQAVLNHNLGQLVSAAGLYERLLVDPAAGRDIRAKSANNLAIIESQLGRPDIADRHARLAAEWATEVGPALLATITTTRAWITMQTGRLTESVEIFDQAADQYAAVGLPLGEHYLEYADALIDLRLLPEALQVARRAVDEFQRNGVDLMAAEGQYRVAVLALSTGDPATATASAEAAYAGFTRQRRPVWAARTAIVLAEIALRLGNLTVSTLNRARQAARKLEELGVVAHAVDAHLVVGRAALALDRNSAPHLLRAQQLAAGATVLVRLKGHIAGALLNSTLRNSDAAGYTPPATPDRGALLPTGARDSSVRDRAILASCRTGLNDLAQHRASLASMELRVRASGHGAELGRLGLGVLLRSGTPSQVFSWLERTRAAALVAVEPTADLGIDELLAALRGVQTDLAAARTNPGTFGSEPPELLARQAGLEGQIRRATWSRKTSIDHVGSQVSPGELRQHLNGQVLIEYGVHDGALIAAVLEPKRTRIVDLGPMSVIGNQSVQLLFALQMLLQHNLSPARALMARSRAEVALGRLSAMLFEPLHLADDTPLVVVPTGVMQRFPWSAMRGGPVAVSPSAALWEATRTRRPPTSSNVVLVAGPDLPGAEAEIAALARLHDGAIVIEPSSSTVETVLDALSGAGLAHLACHLNMRSDNPSFSSLQLSDGFLTMHEMELRGIAPHRMVLAACNSATDVGYEGNEVLGFVSSLISHGTNALVASIVVVPDAAAVPVMQSLHRGVLDGLPLVDALHQARQNMDRRDPLDFVNWCAFNSYGAA